MSQCHRKNLGLWFLGAAIALVIGFGGGRLAFNHHVLVRQGAQQQLLVPVGRRLVRLSGPALERVKGIEPSSKAWEAFVLPLNYTRTALIYTLCHAL